MKLMNSEYLWNNRTRISALLLALMLLLLTGCGSIRPAGTEAPAETGSAETGEAAGSGSAEETALPAVTKAESENEAAGPHTESAAPEGTDRMIYAHVNGKVLKILAAENSSADAFLDLLKAGDVTVDMHDYGSFEKVGPLGTTLPRNDEQITTGPGDVILYQGDQITIYYDVNSWSFTRLGKVQDLSQAELKEILGSGNASVTFSLSERRAASFRALYERLIFQNLTYNLEMPSCNERQIPVQLLMTSNAPGGAYLPFLRSYQQTLNRFIGPTEIFACGDTLQLKDYGSTDWEWSMFDAEAKMIRHETVFPKQCGQVREMSRKMFS